MPIHIIVDAYEQVVEAFQYEANALSMAVAKAAVAYAKEGAEVEAGMFLPFALEKDDAYSISPEVKAVLRSLIQEKKLPTFIIPAIGNYLDL